MGTLSTHVLDTVSGTPASGLRIELWQGEKKVTEVVTNSDGRTDEPLLSGNDLEEGSYRLIFHLGDYHRQAGYRDAGRFLDTVPIDFRVDNRDAKWHVPLLATPWSYSTYRGS
jgi:5-hydroxyisourate hydrolase